MGVPDRPDYLEAVLLKLTAEHFPLPGSVRDLVYQRYTSLDNTALDMQSMPLEELFEYLRNPDYLDLTPMAAILTQTETIGDPSLPSAEHTALLEWVGAAFVQWEELFPLEQPLQSQLRRLKPLAATLALVDPEFLVPGRHPLHKILDQLQLGAVGWQQELGRAGQAVEKKLVQVVNKAAAWFETEDTNLEVLSEEVTNTTARDLDRAERMSGRLVETELGRLRNAEAKRVAAGMINEALEKLGAPPGIGNFLKGAWYESAQLVLLKFGEESDQWRQICTATKSLLDSVQPAEGDEDPARRQQIFETVTRLPRDLKRWLLSLQHDSDAVENAMGILEYAHLQILRKEPLVLEKIDPIPVASIGTEAPSDNSLESIKTEQWFSVATGKGKPIRVRLVLRLEREAELVFANMVGIKVLQQSFSEFAKLLSSGKVSRLETGASFSRCLALAAGIETTDELEHLRDTAEALARSEEQERQRREQRQHEQERAERLERDKKEEKSQQQQVSDQTQPEPDWLQLEPVEDEQQDEELLRREWDEARRAQQGGGPPATETPQDAKQVEQGAVPEAELSDSLAMPEKNQEAETTDGAQLSAPESMVEDLSALDIPMGTWFGFHDGETPLMAKLAVHDLENNNYTFVNRSGIKMRQLNQRELVGLMEQGLVDILVTRSNFREQISRVKNRSDI